MATLKELQDLHEEVLKVCGEFVATMKTVDGNEPQAQLALLQSCAETIRLQFMEIAKIFSYLMTLKYEDDAIE